MNCFEIGVCCELSQRAYFPLKGRDRRYTQTKINRRHELDKQNQLQFLIVRYHTSSILNKRRRHFYQEQTRLISNQDLGVISWIITSTGKDRKKMIHDNGYNTIILISPKRAFIVITIWIYDLYHQTVTFSNTHTSATISKHQSLIFSTIP